jgi:hypothetical protein
MHETALRPTFRKIRWLILGAGIVFLVCLIWASSSAKPSIAIRFVSLTNAADTGQIMALISVSNSNRRAIFVRPALPEIREGSSWQTQNLRWGTQNLADALPPNHEITFYVARPTNGQPWWVPVWWDLKPNKLDWLKSVWEQNKFSYQENMPLPWLYVGVGMMGYTNYVEMAP